MQTNKVTHNDFRLFLQQELVERCKANPKYSLRAFARRLGLEPSFLSKLIAGKRAVTPKLIERLAPLLDLSPVECERFLNTRKKKTDSVAADYDYRQLTLDTFKMISDWYHYAILELVTVEGFESSPRWIASRLGIAPAEAQAAVERLLRLEMLARQDDGKLVNTSGSNTTVGTEFTATAFRKLQKQILDQAGHALEEIPIEMRDQSSMTMAINSSLVPEAKAMLKDFRRKFCDELKSKELARDHVYQLTLSFFPVTKVQGVSK